MSSEGTRDFWRVIFAWFLPPLGVFLQAGVGGALIINIVLTFLGWLPGVLHALWLISNSTASGRSAPDGTRTFGSLLLCGLLPPLGVFLKRGAGSDLIINILLVFLGGLPGIVHAVWVITRDD